MTILSDHSVTILEQVSKKMICKEQKEINTMLKELTRTEREKYHIKRINTLQSGMNKKL